MRPDDRDLDDEIRGHLALSVKEWIERGEARGEDRLVYIRQSTTAPSASNMTFSVPEIQDIKARASSIGAFGDFSTTDLTMVGVGDPRVVRAGVVNGGYFEVMGLRPLLGRLLDAADDGPDAAAVAVLTYRFWTSSLNGDPSVIGRTIRLGPRNARVVGVLEPSVPYPSDTEIIANVVTSPHHLEAEMVTQRTHRMTELFGRLVTLDAARAELGEVHAAMMRAYPQAYSSSPAVLLSVTPLREQIAGPARPILLVLLGAALLVFLIACANVANLILSRSVRREGELPRPRRIVGIVADVDDENVVPGPALTIYHPVQQAALASRLFVHTDGDPYDLAPEVTRIIRGIAPDQAVERAATLQDVTSAGAGARAAERPGVLGLCCRCVVDRGGRRRRRAGFLGECAHARVRRAAGARLDAAGPALARAVGGGTDRRDWCRRRRSRRLRHRPVDAALRRKRAAARCAAGPRCGRPARRGGRHRCPAARGTGGSRGPPACAESGVVKRPTEDRRPT